MSAATSLRWTAACFGAVLTAAAFAGCGGAPPAPAPKAATPRVAAAAPAASGAATSEPEFDPCAGSPAVPHPYKGILRVAKCEQDMFLTMADTAGQLGVECRFCHVALKVNGKDDPKKEDYPVMTPKKHIANWMSMHLMQSIKPADGGKMKCKLCHTDDSGKPVTKILGSPRNIEKAQEWMTMVMVNRFVGLNGEKLKCKSCHVDNLTKPGWQSRVILTDHIPPH